MTEQELRALVREALIRHTGSGTSVSHRQAEGPLHRRPVQVAPSHSSHGLFVLPVGSDSDGPCIIEPAVSCNHCGYCKSYGH
jgi:hypothetical protein